MPNATELDQHPADSRLEGGRRLLSLAEARARTSLGRTYLWELTRSGQLPTVRIGRRVLIDERDLDAFIDAHREAPPE
jgi:excisionase family DNA binding protein